MYLILDKGMASWKPPVFDNQHLSYTE